MSTPEVRVTVRLQWDTTVSACEVRMPADALMSEATVDLVEQYAAPVFLGALKGLKAKSVEKLCEQLEV